MGKKKQRTEDKPSAVKPKIAVLNPGDNFTFGGDTEDATPPARHNIPQDALARGIPPAVQSLNGQEDIVPQATEEAGVQPTKEATAKAEAVPEPKEEATPEASGVQILNAEVSPEATPEAKEAASVRSDQAAEKATPEPTPEAIEAKAKDKLTQEERRAWLLRLEARIRKHRKYSREEIEDIRTIKEARLYFCCVLQVS